MILMLTILLGIDIVTLRIITISMKGTKTMKAKSNIWVFILITYGFSWLFWIPDALIAQNILNAPEGLKNILALNLGAWGPLVGAIITTLIFQKGAGVKKLLKRGFMVKLGKWWWITLLIFPLLIGGALGISILLGYPVPEFVAMAEPIGLPIAFVYIFCMYPLYIYFAAVFSSCMYN